MKQLSDIERKCSNCTYYPCTRVDCKADKICDLHMFEHENIIKKIEKEKNL